MTNFAAYYLAQYDECYFFTLFVCQLGVYGGMGLGVQYNTI